MVTATVKELMTREVVFASTHTSLFEAAQLMRKNSIAGLPVVDEEGKIVGIITEYHIIKGVEKALPAVEEMFENVSFQDSENLGDDVKLENIKTLTSMEVGSIMNDDPLTVTEDASFEDVLNIFSKHHSVNPIPVLDPYRRVVGIISRYDIIKLFNALV